ncbi:MAG: ribosome-associated translation inhibitor RaiA [Vicinamibacterales bacterium]|jgi:putative sigma-54 modulation protein|nr:ribosome-associated translation inhibitor RaiA [Vicinamibacterales bacterium]
MRLTLTGRHVEITPAITRLVERKMARLERVLNTRAVSGQVELWPEKFRHVVEVHVHARGGHMLKGRAVATSWDEALSLAVDRLIQQGKKLKGKWQERTREARPVKRTIPEPRDAVRRRRVIRARRYPVRPMSVEEAALALAPEPDAFLVFRNTDTDAVSVVFRRKDGDIGLIEPKA